MKHYIVFDGRAYTISVEFATAVKKVLGTLSFNSVAVEQEHHTLLLVSNRKRLTVEQVERLQYLRHVLNVLNTIAVVGAHHDPVLEWGFDGWDAVHGNEHRPIDEETGVACGCHHRYVFDHHSATNHFGHNRLTPKGVQRKHFHIEPVHICEKHLT